MIYCAVAYAIEGLLDGEKTLKRDGLVTDAGAILEGRRLAHDATKGGCSVATCVRRKALFLTRSTSTHKCQPHLPTANLLRYEGPREPLLI